MGQVQMVLKGLYLFKCMLRIVNNYVIAEIIVNTIAPELFIHTASNNEKL